MKKAYKYNRVFGGTAYAPFGEVVDYEKHSDVDGFMYLSNSVVPMELSIPKLSLY